MWSPSSAHLLPPNNHALQSFLLNFLVAYRLCANAAKIIITINNNYYNYYYYYQSTADWPAYAHASCAVAIVSASFDVQGVDRPILFTLVLRRRVELLSRRLLPAIDSI